MGFFPNRGQSSNRTLGKSLGPSTLLVFFVIINGVLTFLPELFILFYSWLYNLLSGFVERSLKKTVADLVSIYEIIRYHTTSTIACYHIAL